ncbi:putative RDD family membrane protein YckC [Caulobacter ginsengisoli]|uniref:RDD family membrane protein YckC n=1 Tax=Caulobacter ginsengisoli TaxID=400775 RepID=A0ABU0IUY2_9CAUL|nr:RDD family protein [Caulobacter ginsengisoli]MDQ0465814.1 putative RDD family membrane protein YckC [Caulobacter ginsengisoli]
MSTIDLGQAPPGQRELITPEGVDLRVRLADGGQRIGAFVLDLLFMIIVWIVADIAIHYAYSVAGKDSGEVLGIVYTLGLFVLRSFYFTGFEMTARAATPGKRILGIRVAARNGGRLRAEMIFARNAMRELEFFLPVMVLLMSVFAPYMPRVDGGIILAGVIWTGIFLLFPLFNRDRLRAGDLIAGTWVVQAPKRRLLADLSDDGAEQLKGFDFTPAQLAAYGVKELQVLEQVLRANDRATLKAVAERIRRKIDWTPAMGERDRDFLSAYYVALRGRLENRLLFGHRRKDKFDKA